jgi:hypothetical protein
MQVLIPGEDFKPLTVEQWTELLGRCVGLVTLRTEIVYAYGCIARANFISSDHTLHLRGVSYLIRHSKCPTYKQKQSHEEGPFFSFNEVMARLDEIGHKTTSPWVKPPLQMSLDLSREKV